MMKNNYMKVCLLSMAMVPASAYGPQAAAQEKMEVSLEQCQEMALEHNPYILNSQLQLAAGDTGGAGPEKRGCSRIFSQGLGKCPGFLCF